MTKGRLEAFSDGVLAIIITIMVLELRAPDSPDLDRLQQLWPVFLSYILSFVHLGIYWNNHHHMLHTVRQVSGGVLWANLHLLFWLSLVPFTTGWMGVNHFAPITVSLYGIVLMMAGIAYYILARSLVLTHGKDSLIARAIGHDFKGKISVVLYAAAIPLAFYLRWGSLAIYVLVAVMWLVPDKRMERVLHEENGS